MKWHYLFSEGEFMGFKYEAIKAYLIDHGVDTSLAETNARYLCYPKTWWNSQCLFPNCF